MFCCAVNCTNRPSKKCSTHVSPLWEFFLIVKSLAKWTTKAITVNFTISWLENDEFWAPSGSVGRAVAPFTEAMSSPQQTRVWFHLWPFAACHSPSLFPVSCPLFSCPVLIKAQKAKKYLKKKQNLHSLSHSCHSTTYIIYMSNGRKNHAGHSHIILETDRARKLCFLCEPSTDWKNIVGLNTLISLSLSHSKTTSLMPRSDYTISAQPGRPRASGRLRNNQWASSTNQSFHLA